MTPRSLPRTALLGSLLLAACATAGGDASVPATPRATAVAEVGRALPSDVVVESGLHAPLPVGVTSFGATAHGGYAYVLGGYHGTPHDYHREGQSRAFLRMRLDGGPWEHLGDLEGGLQGLALVSVGGRVCRLGGTRIENAPGEPAVLRSVDEAACFDPTRGSWAALPSLPAPRSSHEAAVVDGVAYIAGGWSLGEGGSAEADWPATVLALELDGGTWRPLAAPFQRRALGVASAANRLVMVGGLTPEREVSARVDVFDPATGAWSRGPDFPADAFGLAAVGWGDAVFASGRDGVLYRWEVGSPAWTSVASHAFPRFFHQLVPHGDGELAVIGGIGGMRSSGRTRLVERQPLAPSTEPAILTFTLPYPGRAKNRQGVFVHDESVYFFGGNDSLGQHDFEPEHFVAEGLRFHIPSLTFAETAPFPVPRQTMQTVVTESGGIAVGGFGHDGTAAVTHPEAFAFDFETERWSSRGGLPRGRTQFGLVAHGEALWVFGGLNFDPARSGPAAFEHETSVLAAALTEADGAFEPAPVELPGPRRAFAGARLGGRYYLVGGMREGFELVDDCLVFDFADRSFAPMACPSQTRLSGHLLALEDRLVLLGGSVRGDDGMASESRVEVYDPEADRWRTLIEALPFDMRHAHVQRLRDRILVLSTHHEEPRLQVALIGPVDRD